MAGPPRDMFADTIEPDEWQEMVDRYVWLRLAKLDAADAQLGQSARQRLVELSAGNPHWQLATDERDEFSHWMSGTSDPDYKSHRIEDRAPIKAVELVSWLKQPTPEKSFFYEDNWQETCRKHMLNSMCALQVLAGEGQWPTHRWRVALQVWGEQKRVRRSWRYAVGLVKVMPDSALAELAHQVSWWLKEVSASIVSQDEALVELCNRVLGLSIEAKSGITRNGEPINQPVTEAINHPVGHVTQALLNLWFKKELNDNDLLPSEISATFTRLCDTHTERFRHGRVLLCAQVIPLFRVDQAWAVRYVLPLFDWTGDKAEARAAWEGFLWSPRLYLPLLIAFKPAFLQTAHHYSELGEHGRQFAAFLTYAALEPLDGYVVADFRTALGALPQEGLREAAQALAQAMEGAGDQRAEYWKNRVQPFWQNVWPKSQDMVSPAIADHLARVAIASDSGFPAALEGIRSWLQPVPHPDYLVRLLKRSSLCPRFPNEALQLLDAIIRDQLWVPDELNECLLEISKASPPLKQDSRHQRLTAFYRQRRL
jgi:hypothetical protein